MAALYEAGQEYPRLFAWLGRAMAFIGATVVSLAIGSCSFPSEKTVVEKVSFSRWEVSIWEQKPYITFYSVGTPSRGLIHNGIVSVYISDIFAEVSPELLLPGTALVSNWEKRKGSIIFMPEPELSYVRRATLFVSSQTEADAWNRYFAELLAERERKMREKWGPKKIQPPPTLQKSD